MISNRSLTITTLFVLSLIGAYTIYQPFLLSLVVAMLLTMATYNLTKQLIRMTGSRKISAAISTLFLIVIVFAPIVYLATVGVSYVAALDVKAVNTIFLTIRGLADGITFLDEWSDTVLSDQKVTAYIQTFTSYVTTAGTVGLGFIKNMFLVLVFFFMINFYGERFFDLIRALIPISRIKSAKMIHEISSTMEVVLYSIIATAI
ncbi:MAG TPA: AI-2E family transporter, partial [Epsilonproteobacteria bacterium]|nr:AI-2E family transporter [Campylobacterota bacterium]